MVRQVELICTVSDIATYEDHRIASALSWRLAGAGVRVHGEDCVAKSFPDFWERFEGMVKLGV